MRTPIRSLMIAAAVLGLPAGAGRGQERPPAKQDVRLVVQTGHVGRVQCVAFSPDGKLVLTGADDHTARLWDAHSGMELLTFAGHTAPLNEVKFSPDGKWVLTAGDDKTARLWDAQTGKELLVIKGHDAIVTSVAFSPDGKRFATGGTDQTARVWNAQTGKQELVLQGHAGTVHSVAFAPLDGKRLLTGSADQTARLWDAQSGKEVLALKGHTDTVYWVAYAPDGKRVLTGSFDKTARLWDAKTGKEISAFKGHTDAVTSVVFSTDGKRVVTASKDHSARLWDVQTGKELFVLKRGGAVFAAAFAPDGKRVITASGDREARLWDAQTGKEVLTLQGDANPVHAVAFSPDGKRILTGSGARTTGLWDTQTGTQLSVLKRHRRVYFVNCVAFAPDSKSLATSSENSTARLWDAQSGKELPVLQGHTRNVTAVAFSPDGRRVLTGSADQTARLWDAQTGKEGLTLKGHTESVTSVAFSPEGKRLLTGSLDLTARLWDAQTGKELRAFKGHEQGLLAVAFSPDGKRVLTGSADQTARLWDAQTGKELRAFKGHGQAVRTVAFSPDGKSVLTGSQDHTARLWDAQTGKELRAFKGHVSTVNSAVFSPNGKQILTGSEDQTSVLWGVPTGKELCRLVTLRSGWAVIDPEGRFDASHGGDLEGLHMVVGLEPLALTQIKDRYYEPGLLAKHLGFNKEPLRIVGALRDLKLYPDLAVDQKDAKKPQMNVTLTNRGGGIGRVTVLVNGKERTDDLRPRGAASANAAKLDLTLDLSNDPRLVPGQKNKVEVLAYNADGYLCSRGMVREFDGPGAASADPPAVHAVVVGIAKYQGDKLNLRYAAKDADDFAAALKLAAGRFFGADKVHLTVLTAAAGNARPTRANLVKALEALKTTKPGDIVVVYLAGHGVTAGGQDGDWHYLTADAQSADLADPAVRQQVSLSSKELTEWLKAAPAQKQVLVLDTCHSGRLVEKLSEKRDVPGSQVRALERVKDRTGMYVLAGCAADAVSYEASRYGQGLLTYSLLLAMRGAKLREGEYVDVAELFGFAADKVPELARDIGGVQRPLIASPRGASFDIGRLTTEDQAKVPLQALKPIVVRSSFQEDKRARDGLNLTRRVDERLREASSAARGAKLVFVDAADFPGGLQAAGRYKAEGDKMTVSVTLFEGEKELATFTAEGAANKPDELAEKIAAEVEKKLAAGGNK